jgi:import receptor subunit TOM22
MVLVEEVPEEVLLREGERESDFEDDSNASETSSEGEDDFDPSAETVYDRIVALKDMVSPRTRSSLASSINTTKSWASWGWFGAGTVAWWISTSALLVGLPLALAIEDETRIVQQEREMQMQSQGQQQVGQYFIATANGSFSVDHLSSNKEFSRQDSSEMYNIMHHPSSND